MLTEMIQALTGRPPLDTGEVMKALAVEPGLLKWQRTVIPYVLFQISCDRGADITAPVAAALRIIRRPGCVCEAHLSTLMFITFPGEDGLALRNEVAAELIRTLGPRVRLLRGRINGVVGQIGRGEHHVSGSAFVGLERLMNALFTQSFGYHNTLDLIRSEESVKESVKEPLKREAVA